MSTGGKVKKAKQAIARLERHSALSAHREAMKAARSARTSMLCCLGAITYHYLGTDSVNGHDFISAEFARLVNTDVATCSGIAPLGQLIRLAWKTWLDLDLSAQQTANVDTIDFDDLYIPVHPNKAHGRAADSGEYRTDSAAHIHMLCTLGATILSCMGPRTVDPETYQQRSFQAMFGALYETDQGKQPLGALIQQTWYTIRPRSAIN